MAATSAPRCRVSSKPPSWVKSSWMRIPESDGALGGVPGHVEAGRDANADVVERHDLRRHSIVTHGEDGCCRGRVADEKTLAAGGRQAELHDGDEEIIRVHWTGIRSEQQVARSDRGQEVSERKPVDGNVVSGPEVPADIDDEDLGLAANVLIGDRVFDLVPRVSTDGDGDDRRVPCHVDGRGDGNADIRLLLDLCQCRVVDDGEDAGGGRPVAHAEDLVRYRREGRRTWVDGDGLDVGRGDGAVVSNFELERVRHGNRQARERKVREKEAIDGEDLPRGKVFLDVEDHGLSVVLIGFQRRGDFILGAASEGYRRDTRVPGHGKVGWDTNAQIFLLSDRP